MGHGCHLKVLGRATAALLADAKNVESTVREVMAALGPNSCRGDDFPPAEEASAIVSVHAGLEDSEDLAAVALVPQAHSSLHVWPQRPFFALDVCAAFDFDSMRVEQVLVRRLGAYDLQVTDLTFALEYEHGSAPRKASRRDGRESLRGWVKTPG
jgi:hypothetical protein